MLAAAVAPVLFVLATATGPDRIVTNTDNVTALAAADGTLWAATRGGLEEYDEATLVRRRLYTTADGLAANAVVAVAVEGGDVVARTEDAVCVRRGGRFVCTFAAHAAGAAPAAPALFEGARVTERLTVGARTFVATAGRGLWIDGTHPRALTPADQISSNHITAMVRFRGAIWLGSFDQGLSRFDGQRFRRVRAPIRMINDLAVAKDALYVASTRGLFRSRAGEHFQRVAYLDGRGITGLAVDGDTLWAVSPVALWRVPLGGRGWLHGFPLPGGAHAVQAVDAAAGVVWMASEDRGAIRFRGGQFQSFDRAAGLPTSWAVGVAATADGGAYLATLRHGLLKLDADGSARPVPGVPDNWLLHVGRAGDGVWVGTQGGAARVRDGGSIDLVTGLPNPCVHAIATFDDETWFATEGGLAIYRRSSWAARGSTRSSGSAGVRRGQLDERDVFALARP
ncbi:MAG TPA: hypothetical protein VGL59_17590 [Polyangia bacterium]